MGGVLLSILSILSLSFFTFFCEGQCFGDKMDKMDKMGGQNGQKGQKGQKFCDSSNITEYCSNDKIIIIILQ